MNISSAVFITGIGTDVGKTVVSAILSEAHACSYWKPVQAGELENTDSMKIRSWCSEKVSVLAEKFCLKTPASPHLAAKIDGIDIQESDFTLPGSGENTLIEGAGGLMVPLNDSGLLYLDLLKKWNLPLVLVSTHYLGSINHTLLSLETIRFHKLNLKALIFTGKENPASEEIILKRFPQQLVHRIPFSETISREFIQDQAKRIKFDLFKKDINFRP